MLLRSCWGSHLETSKMKFKIFKFLARKCLYSIMWNAVYVYLILCSWLVIFFRLCSTFYLFIIEFLLKIKENKNVCSIFIKKRSTENCYAKIKCPPRKSLGNSKLESRRSVWKERFFSGHSFDFFSGHFCKNIIRAKFKLKKIRWNEKRKR